MNMEHMKFLDTVAGQDVALLREKESTYQGSWKRAGGRSAWFMLRRNMDRLLTMMARPKDEIQFSLADLDDALEEAEDKDKDFTCDHAVVRYLRDCYLSEDIFAKIAEKPLGEDGTILAVIRDLRCYLLLVEAEMIARGELKSGFRTHVEGGVYYETSFGLVEDGHRFHASGLTKVQCDELRDLVNSFSVQNKTNTGSEGERFVGKPVDGFLTAEQQLYPWMITIREHETMPNFQQSWYVRRGDFYFLEEYVENAVFTEYTEQFYFSFNNVAYLRLEKIPAELRENYRYMSRELNDKEYQDLPRVWRNMYSFGNDTKWHLRFEFRDAWGRNT